MSFSDDLLSASLSFFKSDMSLESVSFFCLKAFKDFSSASALCQDSLASLSSTFFRMLASWRACVASVCAFSCFFKSSRSCAFSLFFSSSAAVMSSMGLSSSPFCVETCSRRCLSFSSSSLALSRSLSNSSFSVTMDSCSFSMISFSADMESNQFFSCSISSALRFSCTSSAFFSTDNSV